MIDTELATADELKAIDISIKKEIDEATKIAKADKEIGVEELTTDIYCMNQEGDVRGITGNKMLKHTSLNRAVNK